MECGGQVVGEVDEGVRSGVKGFETMWRWNGLNYTKRLEMTM